MLGQSRCTGLVCFGLSILVFLEKVKIGLGIFGFGNQSDTAFNFQGNTETA